LNAAFCERQVFGNAAVEVVGHHDHIEGLFERVRGVRACRARRSRNDVCETTDLNNVRCVASAGAFGMERVNGSAFECGNRVFDKAAFVQRIGVDQDLDVHVVGDGKTAVDGGRCCAPVFVKFQAADTRFDLLHQGGG